MRLRRSNILRSCREISLIKKTGETCSGKYLIINYLKGQKEAKFCFIITKKIGKANKRNLVRRRLREIIIKNGSKISPMHFLIISKKEIMHANFFQLEKELLQLLKNIGSG